RVEGLNIYAIGEGWVSRIRITHGSYGKALYITHPNGYVSLYGHLSNYNGPIADYVLEEQYKRESYEMDIELEKGVLPVTKGQIVAFSGTTGSSQGPHLHFEIRDAKTQETSNPLLFGLPMKDYKAPSLKSIRIARVNGGKGNGSPNPVDYTLAHDKYGKAYL